MTLLERFHLGEKRNARFAQLSRGMKRALTIAAALAHRPQLVFLDEPTLGLDVMSARNLRQRVAGLRDEGVTVFLTTHYMEEAEQLCDRVAILVGGRIVALDTIEGLRQQAGGVERIEATALDAQGRRHRWVLAGQDPDAALREALARAETLGGRIIGIETRRPSFEDVFVQLSGLGAEAMHNEKAERQVRDVGG
jgi:ABC-2 type transport system ATP-binding protein